MTSTASPQHVQPRDLRVSDTEREQITSLLRTAVGRGLLSLDEFTERADIAYAATTRGELNVALADLPGLKHADAPRPDAADSASSQGQRQSRAGGYRRRHRHRHWGCH